MVVDGSIVHLEHSTVGVMPVVVKRNYILKFGFSRRMSSLFSFVGERVKWVKCNGFSEF